jgi:hypothetical protein
MFGLFNSEPYYDPELGEFQRSHGHWLGGIELGHVGMFRLSLAGDRKAPHPQALQLSRELHERFPSLVSEIQRGLFEHYLPYKEAVEEATGGSFPPIADSAGVWAHVNSAHVLIELLNGQWRVEVGLTTDWDIEHTVAAIYSDWKFIELNGSVRAQ